MFTIKINGTKHTWVIITIFATIVSLSLINCLNVQYRESTFVRPVKYPACMVKENWDKILSSLD